MKTAAVFMYTEYNAIQMAFDGKPNNENIL